MSAVFANVMDDAVSAAPWLRSGGCVRGSLRTIGRLLRVDSDGIMLREEVRGYDADEFAGGDYFGLLPELWKMALVAGYQVVSAGSVSTFQELVVVRILCDLKRTRRFGELCMVLYELKKLLLKAFADFEFSTREDF